MTRIAWSPDGSRLLVCQRGGARVHDVEGAVIRTLAMPAVQAAREDLVLPLNDALRDARWIQDGRILAIDAAGSTHRYTMHYELTRDAPAPAYVAYGDVVLADHADVFAAIDARQSRMYVVTATTPPTTVWSPNEATSSVRPPIHGDLCLALSAYGHVVVIGYSTRGSSRGPAGRGWVAYDLAPRDASLQRGYLRPKPELLDRDWYPVELGAGTLLRFAFARTGRRLAIAGPEATTEFPAIRLRAKARGTDPVRAEPRTIAGGACAIAIDDRGVVVARAYPRVLAERRLRVDYLATHGKSDVVEAIDTIWLDPELGANIAALAFDADSRRLACLDEAGAVEVLPVL